MDYELEQAQKVFDVDKFMDSNKIEYKTSGDERVLECPLCNGAEKLWFNAARKIGYCYKCETPFPPVVFVEKLGDLSRKDAAKYLIDRVETIHSQEVDDLFEDLDCSIDVETELELPHFKMPPRMKLPKGSIRLDRSGAKAARRYLKQRGLTREDIAHYNLRFCETGRFADRIIIPVVVRERMVTFVARSIDRNNKLRYLYPTGTPTGRAIFNFDAVYSHNKIVICEGVFDAMNVGHNAIALLGKNLSKDQLLLLAESAAGKTFVLMLDGDKAGVEATVKVAQKLSAIGDVKIVPMPDEGDPGDMNRKEIKALLRTAMSWDVMEGFVNL